MVERSDGRVEGRTGDSTPHALEGNSHHGSELGQRVSNMSVTHRANGVKITECG
jgi:hypothetical protein